MSRTTEYARTLAVLATERRIRMQKLPLAHGFVATGLPAEPGSFTS